MRKGRGLIKTYAGAIRYIWRLGIGPRYMDDIGCFPSGPNWHRVALWFWFNRQPVVEKEA